MNEKLECPLCRTLQGVLVEVNPSFTEINPYLTQANPQLVQSKGYLKLCCIVLFVFIIAGIALKFINFNG